MLMRLLAADWLKLRRTPVRLLAVLGPLGVVTLMGVNYGLRYDWLMESTKHDPWGIYLRNIAALALPTLFVGLALVASMIAGLEHRTFAWKQLLALPVRRGQVFFSKFLLVALLLLGSSTLLAAGTLGLAALIGLDFAALPRGMFFELMYYPYLAVMPFVALQLWLSVGMANQAVPLTVGIAGTVFSMFGGSRFGDWFPYRWPTLENAAGEPFYSALYGILLGAVLLGAGTVHFIRKDVR